MVSRMLLPAVTCPRCGALPPQRIAEEERARYQEEDPARAVGTLRCPQCHRVYPVTAAAYRDAA